MNEAWLSIAKEYIKSYEAIKILMKNRVIEDDLQVSLNMILLNDIIETFRSEVE